MKIRKPSSVQSGLVWAFYGASGSGKTVLACSFPTPLLVINTEGSSRVQAPARFGWDVDIYDASSAKEVLDILSKERNTILGYKTLVLDSLTRWQVMLEPELGNAISAIEGTSALNVPLAPQVKQLARRQDWRAFFSLNKSLLLALTTYSGQLNVVITSALGEERDVDQRTMELRGILYRPLLWGQVSEIFPQFCNVLALLKRENNVTTAYFSSGKQPIGGVMTHWIAKDDTGRLPASLVIPDAKETKPYEAIERILQKEESRV